MEVLINTTWLLLVAMGLLNQCQNADGILWVVKPDAFTYGPQGTNISMRWNYKLETNEVFLTSVINYKGVDLASRHPGENSYAKYVGYQSISFSISGAEDVTLTIHNAKVVNNGKFCCEVDYKSNEGKLKKEECTTLFAYVLPVITSQTPDVSCKQRDVIKLQCNATGYPQPSGVWIYRQTHKTIANSFTTLLNIINKQSEGTYCCEATNRFGKQTKCSWINVVEYEPQNTTLSSQTSYIIKNKGFQAQCAAEANPAPYYIFKQNNTKMQNSTKGVFVSGTLTGDEAVQVSCVPWNKYGLGPERKIVLPVAEKPKLRNNLRTSYNMTAKTSITLTCRATGNPAPNISWTKGESSEVVSVKEYYEVDYECSNETLVFYCTASNIAGSVRSPQIKVQTDRCIIPRDKKVSPIYEPPSFANDLVTNYSLTTNSINITCNATGIPKPSITWTKGESNEVISSKEYYEVPLKNYDKSKLVFYCHASNVLGKARSSEIQVHVMTKDKDIEFLKVGPDSKKYEIIVITAVSLTVVFLIVIVFAVIIRICKTGTSRIKEHKEPPHVEQIDAVPIIVSGKVGEVVPHQKERYATIEEVAYEEKKKSFFKRKKKPPANDQKLGEKKGEDPVYAVVKKEPRSKETV